MNKTLLVAISLLTLSAGAALAEGGGEGPFGVPQPPGSLPKGFENGNLQYMGLAETNHYLQQQAARLAPAAAHSNTGAEPAPSSR